jgi:N-formylglutamate amidohydrolase
MTQKKFSQAAFITAFNPYSEILDESENLKRHTELSKELVDLGYEFILGIGRDKEGGWEGEKSVLVLNIPNDTAKFLGNKYGQNAIVWIEKDAIPNLVLLDGKDFELPIIMHIPHSSLSIPSEDQVNFCISPENLRIQVDKLNDHFTDELFNSDLTNVKPLIFPVNRFLVDVERFENDEYEPMSLKGMGATYTHDTNGNRFRSDLNHEYREELLNKYYRPHHSQLNKLSEQAIKTFGKVLIVDAHSFPDIPLHCDNSQSYPRPDVCLGTDSFHTPDWITKLVKNHFEKNSFTVEINNPYAGTMVPLNFYKKEKRLHSIMIEINRRLYLDDKYQIMEPKLQELCKTIDKLLRVISNSYQFNQT